MVVRRDCDIAVKEASLVQRSKSGEEPYWFRFCGKKEEVELLRYSRVQVKYCAIHFLRETHDGRDAAGISEPDVWLRWEW